jgi:aerobic C4-dicarboxylate transport protein
MPAEDPVHDVTDIDDDLAEYGHHAPRHAGTDGAAPSGPAAVGPSTDRRPAYSETV